MKKLLLVSLAALALVACSDDDDNDPITNIRQALEDRDLQGKTFESACMIKPIDAILTGILTGGNASIKSARTQYLFEGANITRTTLLFSDANCTDHALTFEERGTVDIDADQRTNDGGKFIDIDYRSVHADVISDKGLEVANSVKLCGAENWTIDEDKREVTEQAADRNCYGAEVPRQVANIYRVDADNLYLGTHTEDAVGTSERPTTLDFGQKYVAK